MTALRRRSPRPWPPAARHNRPYSDTGRPRSPWSRCHSAHQRPPRGSSEPARVSDMLGQTDRRRQSAGGPTGEPAKSARMSPRGAGTTASAAPPSRSDQDAEALDSGGAGPGLCPEWERARCARIFRMTAGVIAAVQDPLAVQAILAHRAAAVPPRRPPPHLRPPNSRSPVGAQEVSGFLGSLEFLRLPPRLSAHAPRRGLAGRAGGAGRR